MGCRKLQLNDCFTLKMGKARRLRRAGDDVLFNDMLGTTLASINVKKQLSPMSATTFGAHEVGFIMRLRRPEMTGVEVSTMEFLTGITLKGIREE